MNRFLVWWINFKNGFWDCKERKLIPHSPEYLALNQIPWSYEPTVELPGEKIERFLNFSVPNPDDLEMLLQFSGLCLTQDVSPQKFLILNGVGGSGKSTLIRLIESMVGSENVSNIPLGTLSHRFSAYRLVGRLLNSCADLEIEALADTSTIKRILGEDGSLAERKGHDAFSFKNYSKQLFSTNELPIVAQERTTGFYRRLMILSMNSQPTRVNLNLFDDLHQELDYFLHLAVSAACRMYEHGAIHESSNSKAAVERLSLDSDSTEAFLSECCKKEAGGRVERTLLFNAYLDCC